MEIISLLRRAISSSDKENVLSEEFQTQNSSQQSFKEENFISQEEFH